MSETKKIDITSTALEKGIDLAKDFLNKLIMPTVEEAGLLLKDQVASWRFNNQVKILNKAQEKCKANNISPKSISLKILCPYLENASLEEDEFMQDKWANLLTNLVDSKQNIENNVFPYILSQISKNEFFILEREFRRIIRLELENDDEDFVFVIKLDAFDNYERHNLNRLGIIKVNPVYYADLNAARFKEGFIFVSSEEIEIFFTELGRLFLSMCTERK